MEYVKKSYIVTRTMAANGFLNSYTYKFNITHLQPFLDKLKQKKLVGLQCQGCNRVFIVPKSVCGKCFVKLNRWVDVRETAKVATYTITYVKDEETDDIIQIPIVLVQHDGSDSTYLAELSPEIRYEDVYIGMPIKAKWRDVTTGGIDDIEYYEKVIMKSRRL